MIIKIVTWIVYGLIVGAIARFLMPGNDSNNWLSAILLGIVGSFVGGFIGKTIFGKGDDNAGKSWIFEFGLSVLGAILLMLLNRFFLHL